MSTRAVVFASLLLGLAACDDVPVVSSSSSERAPAPSAKPGASDLPPPAPRVEIDESELAESDRSRDPFRSYARLFAAEERAHQRPQRKVVLSEYSIDELKLIGIVTRVSPPRAMLVDPTGKGHVVQRGQFVGRPDLVRGSGPGAAAYQVNWRVQNIRKEDVVLVREDPTNPGLPLVSRVIPLRTEAALLDMPSEQTAEP
ncbi:MAG: pilus assembly protein PilP [Pseudomonadota bacterium]|nr:MAG: pilus assembly protein PilP [Pseudomonadota bacterium]